MVTNIQIKNHIYATTYIASWLRSGGSLKYNKDIRQFCRWLESEGLTRDEIIHVRNLAVNGKLELENSASKFREKESESKPEELEFI